MTTDGLCECGCGEQTGIAKQNRAHAGHVKGRPYRFRIGHHRRKQQHFAIEDRGHSTPCWIWLLGKSKSGYGMVYAATGSRRAHRVYWERENGEVPEGLDLDHLCKQTDCVNPEHLEPVTHQENMRRGCVTKLTLDEVREIKRLRGVVLQRDLASRFGLSLTHISRIQQGHAWGDVEP